MNKNIQFAEGLLQTNDVDTKQGKVKFYFSRTETPDKFSRQMKKNAFNRSFNNNMDQIYHLRMHNQSDVIGKVIEYGTDETGAWVVSKLSQNTAGRDSLILYDEGIYKYHSMGFYLVNSHQEGNIEIVEEAKVVEVSTVLHPAHDGATVISLNDLHSLQKNSQLSDKILERLDNLETRLLAEQHRTSSLEVARDTINFINNFQI